jgi:lipid A 3-O-deacylase
MKKLCALAAAATLSFAVIGSAQAADVTAAIGQSGDSTMVYRLGAQWDWNTSWLQSSVGRLTGYWDLGYTYWDGDIEAGIGVAAFASTELEDNRLGSSFQFEDRIGVGLRFSGQEIGLRALHYSNAGIKQPNDGVEAYTLHYRMSF